MSRIYSSEQVSRGHVDKICDQIADAIVTDCLAHDKDSRVAVEVLIKNDTVVIAVFKRRAVEAIRTKLIDKGCNGNRIYTFEGLNIG